MNFAPVYWKALANRRSFYVSVPENASKNITKRHFLCTYRSVDLAADLSSVLDKTSLNMPWTERSVSHSGAEWPIFGLAMPMSDWRTLQQLRPSHLTLPRFIDWSFAASLVWKAGAASEIFSPLPLPPSLTSLPPLQYTRSRAFDWLSLRKHAPWEPHTPPHTPTPSHPHLRHVHKQAKSQY